MTTITFSAWLLALILLGAPEQEREAVERRLSQLRSELDALRAERQRLSQDEADALAAVEEADRAVAANLAREQQLEASLAASEARWKRATAELARLKEAIRAESARIATIARLAFVLGRDAARIRLLLPEHADARSRALAALTFLKLERSRLIARLRTLAEDSARLLAEAEAERRALEADREALRETRGRLEQARRAQHERARALRGLRESAEARAAALDREAAALTALLERLTDVFADLPGFMAGASLADRRGGLLWPVQGEVVERFGSRDEFGRPRRALGIAADEGSPIRAVAHGRVAFADWFPGMGMLLVLDHGDGFLTLYGHLGTLLAEPGEWVGEGQTIGLLGRSGGIERAKLHFELRRHGRALDPQSWLAANARR